jgi:hypothetical protein
VLGRRRPFHLFFFSFWVAHEYAIGDAQYVNCDCAQPIESTTTLSVDAVHGSHIIRKINQLFAFRHALEEVQQLSLAYNVMRILVEVPT